MYSDEEIVIAALLAARSNRSVELARIMARANDMDERCERITQLVEEFNGRTPQYLG